MSHILVAIDATEESHKRILKNINNRKYPLTGPGYARKGYCVPQMSEIKFYNIRTKKEINPEFLRDLKAYNMLSAADMTSVVGAFDRNKLLPHHEAQWWFKLRCWFFAKIIRTLFKFARIDPPPANATGQEQPFVECYYNTFCFGVLKDEETRWGEWL